MRNQKNGGFRLKHALQIFLLLAFCIWLLYHMKHSHDSERNVSTATEDVFSNVVRYGRKDLPPTAVDTNTETGKVIDDNENEEAGGETENNLEEDSEEGGKGVGEGGTDEKDKGREGADGGGQGEESTEDEEKEVKSDEQGVSTSQEGEGAGGGGQGEESTEDEEKEIKSDEQGVSTSQEGEGAGEGGHGEESTEDEEKEVKSDEHGVSTSQEGEGAGGGHGEESTEDEEKEVKSDEQGLSSSQNQDNEEENSQEAREENYRGDDASSAVVLDTGISYSSSRNNNEEKTENIEKDPNVNNKTFNSDNGLKVNEYGVLSGTSELALSSNTSLNGSSSLDGEHGSEFQANLNLIKDDDQVTNQANSTVEPSIAEMQSNSKEAVDTQMKGSFLPNSTIVMASDGDQNSKTEVVNGTEEAFNSIDDGSSKTHKIFIEQTVNSNSTDGPEKVEDSSTTKMGGTSEGENAVQAVFDDPMDTSIDLSNLAETNTNVEEQAAE